MFRTKTPFERVFEKATSNLLLEPDWDSNLQLCDMIRGGDIKARDAAVIIKGKVLEEKNPHVLFFAINVLDIVMKNCGDTIHSEVLTESYMEQLKELVKTSTSDNVKNKLLEVIQAWGVGFKDNNEYKVACNLYSIMKAEGYKFPPPPSNISDMFTSEKAPVWNDGDECSKCNTEFGFVQRKHHCRACGGIFCNKCSGNQAIIPKFGIEKEVRVCDGCFEKLSSKEKTDSADLPREYVNSPLSKQNQQPPQRDEAAIKEEEELQLALALSLDEQENRIRIKHDQDNDIVYARNSKPISSNSISLSSQAAVDVEEDPDLARYLNRSYWDKKKDEINKQKHNDAKLVNDQIQNTINEKKATKSGDQELIADQVQEDVEKNKGVEVEDLQNEDLPENVQMLINLRTSVEIFTNRMKSDQIRGRSIATDSTVQTLFQSINNMHPMLIQFMNNMEEKRLHQEALQDKLVQLRDARAALDALRTEHSEKIRRAAEEAQRQRQIQMIEKLQLMRQKKQEYLAYQRQIALQRMQEQEVARQARLEKHKQFIQQRAMQPSMLIAGYNTQYSAVNPEEQSFDIQQAGMVSNYVYGGYIQNTNDQQLQQPSYQAQSTNTSNQYQGVPATVGFAQPQVSYGVGQAMQHIGAQPPNESYSMAPLNSALPLSTATQHQQVVATAPPPTPQPTTHLSANPPTDPNAAMYQIQQSQKTFYATNSQEMQVNSNVQPSPERDQDLLISFD